MFTVHLEGVTKVLYRDFLVQFAKDKTVHVSGIYLIFNSRKLISLFMSIHEIICPHTFEGRLLDHTFVKWILSGHCLGKPMFLWRANERTSTVEVDAGTDWFTVNYTYSYFCEQICKVSLKVHLHCNTQCSPLLLKYYCRLTVTGTSTNTC